MPGIDTQQLKTSEKTQKLGGMTVGGALTFSSSKDKDAVGGIQKAVPKAEQLPKAEQIPYPGFDLAGNREFENWMKKKLNRVSLERSASTTLEEGTTQEPVKRDRKLKVLSIKDVENPLQVSMRCACLQVH